MTAQVSVVVATHRRPDRLRGLLDALNAQSLAPERFDVIVVDDASGDETQAVLEAEQAAGRLRLCTLEQTENQGPAAARNRGWRTAQAPLIAFTDDDCLPTPGWLEALLDTARAHPGAVVQGPTEPDPAEAHALGPFAKTVNIPGASPHFETCNILYPRSVLERLGGFDESYPAPAGEDSDLGWRAREAGVELAFNDRARVFHAVHTRTATAALADARLAVHGVRAYRDNRELRRHLWRGVFYDRSHPLLLLALLGLLMSRRLPISLVLVVPYGVHLRSRCRAAAVGPGHAAWFAAFDTVQLASTLEGAIRHRTTVL